MALILTSFKTTRQHYSIIDVEDNKVFIADDTRESKMNREPSLRVIFKGIYDASCWRILCDIPFKSVQNGCVNHGSNLAHYAITPDGKFLLALARGSFENSKPGDVFVFKISINTGKYEAYHCTSRMLPPSSIFMCAECNDVTVEARNDMQLTVITRGTNRMHHLMQREHEIRLQENRFRFQWCENTSPLSPSRSPKFYSLPNIDPRFINRIFESETLSSVTYMIQTQYRGPILKFTLRANLTTNPLWRNLLSKGYYSNGVFVIVIDGALMTVVLRMPTLKELAYMALQRSLAKPVLSARYYDPSHAPLNYGGISETKLKSLLGMNMKMPLVPRI